MMPYMTYEPYGSPGCWRAMNTTPFRNALLCIELDVIVRTSQVFPVSV